MNECFLRLKQNLLKLSLQMLPNIVFWALQFYFVVSTTFARPGSADRYVALAAIHPFSHFYAMTTYIYKL